MSECDNGSASLGASANDHTTEMNVNSAEAKGSEQSLLSTAPSVSLLEALGPNWGILCTAKKSTRFDWAHNGKAISGWIEFQEKYVIIASFGEGTWRLSTTDDMVATLEIGQYTYDCRLSSAGRFVVEWKGCKETNKRQSCCATGWPQGCDEVSSLVHDLGPFWGELYKDDKNMRFAWAHDGNEVSGWVEVREAGILFTAFGNGTWKLSDKDSRVMEMVFGTSHVHCRLSRHGRFVAESKYFKTNWKRDRNVSAVGWLESAPTTRPATDTLGPVWGKICSEKSCTRFVWAHDGNEGNGWVQFHAAGVLFTSFGNGTWDLDGEDPSIVEMIFGSSIHRCKIDATGRFSVVEQSFKDGRKRICHTNGWLDDPGEPPAKQRCIEWLSEPYCKQPCRGNGEKRRLIFVGVSGPSGAGKSSLAKRLAVELESLVKPIELDCFFQPRWMPVHEKWGRNWEAAEGVAFSQCIRELQRVKTILGEATTSLHSLKIQGPNYRRIGYDGLDILQQGSIAKSRAAPVTFVVVEGFLLFYDSQLADIFDVHFWIDSDLDTCEARRYERDRGHLACNAAERASFKEWFQSMVWAHYEQYKDVQMKNAKFPYHLSGDAVLESLVSEAVAQCEKTRTAKINEPEPAALDAPAAHLAAETA